MIRDESGNTSIRESATDVPGTVHVSVRNLKPGDKLSQFFQVLSIESRKTRSGDDFVNLIVGDETGSISARLWSQTIRRWGKEFPAGEFVKLEGRVESYKDQHQIVVEKIRKAAEGELSDLKFLTRRPVECPDDLYGELMRYGQSISDEWISDLVVTVLTENAEALTTFPAAKMVHHAYQGGLIEHLVSVTRKVIGLADADPKTKRDLAVAGAILHDIGKIQELKPVGQARTAAGRLLGHVMLGFDILNKVGSEKGCVDEPWFMELQHIVLSHHGQEEYGAPVRPATREALIVHHVDLLDSRLKILDEALASVDGEGFSSYNKWLEGRAYAGYQSPAKEDKENGNA
ncbi:MAG: hypothetical protein QG577_2421 [Thermodesulfobacteriota bacterium]|nr:hypothetical protein [Thermodesulfobacteriota bacterium]